MGHKGGERRGFSEGRRVVSKEANDLFHGGVIMDERFV